MNACAPVFESGMVWRPDMNFAEEVVEECASFPNGEHDDLADSMTQAILRFRQGGFIITPSDYDEDEYREFNETGVLLMANEKYGSNRKYSEKQRVKISELREKLDMGDASQKRLPKKLKGLVLKVLKKAAWLSLTETLQV